MMLIGLLRVNVQKTKTYHEPQISQCDFSVSSWIGAGSALGCDDYFKLWGVENKLHGPLDQVCCVQTLWDCFFILYSFLSLSFLHLDFTSLGDNVTCTLQMDIFFRKPGFDWGRALEFWITGLV